MYDGSIKAVQDIVEGDVLMGDDSSPRTVLDGTLRSGRSELVRIKSHSDLRVQWECTLHHPLVVRIKAKPSMRKIEGARSSEVDEEAAAGQGKAQGTEASKGTWVVQSWTLMPRGKSKTLVPGRVRVSSRYSSAEDAQAEVQRLLEDTWAPLDFVCTAADINSAFSKTAVGILKMRQAQSICWSAPIQPLVERIARITAGSRSDITLDSIDPALVQQSAWAIGFWLATGTKNASIVSVIRSSDTKPDQTGSAVLTELETCAQSISGVPNSAIDLGVHKTAAGNFVSKVDLGDGFRTLLDGYSLLKSKHVPIDLLRESIQVRLAILAGYIDGNGYFDISKEQFLIHNTNRREQECKT
eukprot:jgi/Hompol1/4962/HPOL_004060-RA